VKLKSFAASKFDFANFVDLNYGEKFAILSFPFPSEEEQL
jgi:hypothetical protein